MKRNGIASGPVPQIPALVNYNKDQHLLSNWKSKPKNPFYFTEYDNKNGRESYKWSNIGFFSFIIPIPPHPYCFGNWLSNWQGQPTSQKAGRIRFSLSRFSHTPWVPFLLFPTYCASGHRWLCYCGDKTEEIGSGRGLSMSPETNFFSSHPSFVGKCVNSWEGNSLHIPMWVFYFRS